MSDDRAGSRVAAVLAGLAPQHADGGPAAGDAVSAGDKSTEPDCTAQPDFTTVSVESLHRLLDGLRRLS
jgi:hypothetical protein